jgi:protein phosphatase 1 regulatory subunit 7
MAMAVDKNQGDSHQELEMANGDEEEEEEEGDEDEYMLDLTSAQLHDLAEVDLPPFLKELDLTANRLSLLDDRISHMSQLQKPSMLNKKKTKLEL